MAKTIFDASPAETGQASEAPHEVAYTDYDGKKIGILTGTNMEAESFKYFPNSEYLYFDGYPNMNAALSSGAIDAYLGDEPALKSIHAEQPQIDYLKERLTENRYSFAFRKDDPREKELCDQFNEFLRQIKADGTYDEIDATWFGADESKKVVDMSDLTGENGTIHVVTTSTDEPFSYIKDGKHVGYDIDVAVRFCDELIHLYMDEGSIYEEGSPEQIFEHPRRERTRQFIKHLKTLHCMIDSLEIDYLSILGQIERFGSNAALSPRMLRNVTLAFEELVF